jgi:hypothetical protein
MSFVAFSVVTSVSTEIVRRILVDIFQAVVEASRRTQKEVRLALKKTGHILLFKSRELAFQPVNSDSAPEALRIERGRMREDVSVIDAASAVLSSGGGKAFSIRSSKLSQNSYATPASNLSVKSSLFESKSVHSIQRKYNNPNNNLNQSMRSQSSSAYPALDALI